MLRKKLESESGTEIEDSGFLIIYEKPADSGFGFGLPCLIFLEIVKKNAHYIIITYT